MKKAVFILCSLIISCGVNAQDQVPGQTLYNSDFNIDNIPRTCTFYIPRNYGKQQTYPLFVILHDKGAAAKSLIKNYGDVLHANADSTATIIIYPDAVAGMWNAGIAKDSVNDVGFISILTDYFIQRYGCNPKQVYAAGFGNGAAMAYRLGCDLPGKFTAIASFFNTENKGSCSNMLVPVMPVTEISLSSTGKLTNATLNNMWMFFKQHKKE